MKQGGSDARLLDYENDKVIKLQTFKSEEEFKKSQLYSQYIWINGMYNLYKNIVPKIHSIVKFNDEYGYIMDKFNVDYHSTKSTSFVDNLTKMINAFKDVPLKETFRFSTYCNRVLTHLQLLYQDEFLINIKEIRIGNRTVKNVTNLYGPNDIFMILKQYESKLFPEQSYCHGDFTLENTLKTHNNEIKIIDPNFVNGIWNSWMLDISKLMQSTHYNYEGLFNKDNMHYVINNGMMFVNFDGDALFIKSKYDSYNMLCSKYDKYFKQLLMLEFTHYIRMLKYKRKVSFNEYLKAFVVMNLVYDDYLKR